MKAWLVREKGEFCATVVFADTRNKAKVKAMSTDCCEDTHYCNIEANRVPQLDKYYKDGKSEMDWLDPDDRIALVTECGFSCGYVEDCTACSAKEFCSDYTDADE